MLQMVSSNYDFITGRAEAQIVLSIFEVVEEHCLDGKYPPKLQAMIAAAPNLGFEEAQILLLEYSDESGIYPADHLETETFKQDSPQPSSVMLKRLSIDASTRAKQQQRDPRE